MERFLPGNPEKVSISAIDVLFSGHREFFDMISNYSIGIPDFQP